MSRHGMSSCHVLLYYIILFNIGIHNLEFHLFSALHESKFWKMKISSL